MRQQNSLTDHLVNLTNPMLMNGPIRELIPVGVQKVRLRLSDGVRAKRVHLLAAEKSPGVQRRGDELTITVPSILDHEAVTIDL